MIDASQALFIDDHQVNVCAAREFGLRAEVYHLSEGAARLVEILRRYRLSVG